MHRKKIFNGRKPQQQIARSKGNEKPLNTLLPTLPNPSKQLYVCASVNPLTLRKQSYQYINIYIVIYLLTYLLIYLMIEREKERKKGEK